MEANKSEAEIEIENSCGIVEEILLEAVKAFPILYGKQNKGYKNRNVRDKLWKQVAEKCVEKCKARWKTLRDRFVRELRRKNLPSGSAASSGPEWQFFEAMRFLEEHVAPKKTHSNYADTQEEEAAATVPETVPELSFDDVIDYDPEDFGSFENSPSVMGCSTPRSYCSDDPPAASKRTRKDALQEDFRRVLGQVGTILEKKRNEDEHEGFFMMLRSKFKHMSRKKIDEAKVNILSFLNEIDIGD